jgi:hypothetical protein
VQRREVIGMGLDRLHDFFAASVTASAALLGLLFVAINIQPERTFGDDASGHRLAVATSTFVALGNVLFLSLGGLLPHLNLGAVAVIAGIGGAVNTLLLLDDLRRRAFQVAARTLLITAGILLLYALQVWWGLDLLRHPDDSGAVEGLTYLLLFAYLAGLERAWELLGGPEHHLVKAVRQRRHGPSPERGAEAAPSGREPSLPHTAGAQHRPAEE